jgi:hypothetical protein
MNKLTDIEVAKKLHQLYTSAQQRNLEFDLSFAKVKRLMLAEKCFYTGIKFAKTGPSAKSIDRVDASKGYTDANTVPCTIAINQLKGNLDVTDLVKMVSKLNSFKKKEALKEKRIKVKEAKEAKLKNKAINATTNNASSINKVSVPNINRIPVYN